jgi:hypothetical protein
MPTKSQKMVLASWAWSILALVVLTLLQSVRLEYYVAFSLVGLFIIAQLSGPFRSRPPWKLRLNLVLVLGLIVFILIVLKEALFVISQ